MNQNPDHRQGLRGQVLMNDGKAINLIQDLLRTVRAVCRWDTEQKGEKLAEKWKLVVYRTATSVAAQPRGVYVCGGHTSCNYLLYITAFYTIYSVTPCSTNSTHRPSLQAFIFKKKRFLLPKWPAPRLWGDASSATMDLNILSSQDIGVQLLPSGFAPSNRGRGLHERRQWLLSYVPGYYLM